MKADSISRCFVLVCKYRFYLHELLNVGNILLLLYILPVSDFEVRFYYFKSINPLCTRDSPLTSKINVKKISRAHLGTLSVNGLTRDITKFCG